ncbi:pupal cuticle protein Edg-78E [Aedes aegypti]|uniref:Uncharacterized protein n=1 Tax=Aedes aegypti TaxID=7159 RepID=A0A1S4FJ14_AEDAE|nr:pupal cuticle protein Edg-78E [Aedes aegypti]
MIKLIAASLLIATVLAAPQRRPNNFGRSSSGDERSAVIQQDEYNLNPDGSYVYKYETSNGISASQTGSANGQYANGYYSYTDPEQNRVEVTYLADEFGFQPQGAHLPVEPAAPDHVLKSLEEIRAAADSNPELDIALLDSTIARLRANRG